MLQYLNHSLIVNQRNQLIAIDVLKSLRKLGHLTPNKYNWINHIIHARGSKSLLCLPKVKCEVFRKSLIHYSFVRFKNKLRDYYRKIKSIILGLSLDFSFFYISCF